MIAPAYFLEIEIAADTFVELRLQILCGMVENVSGDVGEVRVGQFKENCWRIQCHQLVSTAEHCSSVYYGP